jgi:hypothetical protein
MLPPTVTICAPSNGGFMKDEKQEFTAASPKTLMRSG